MPNLWKSVLVALLAALGLWVPATAQEIDITARCNQSRSGVLAAVDGNCRIMMLDGAYLGGSSPATIGNLDLLQQPLLAALDISGSTRGGRVCLRGDGGVLFLPAVSGNRTPQPLPGVFNTGYTCAQVPGDGIMVLVAGQAPPQAESGTTLPGLPPPADYRAGRANVPREATTNRQPARASGCTHTVRRGENLFRIGVNNGVTVAQLQAANPSLGGGTIIYPGQVLAIPGC